MTETSEAAAIFYAKRDEDAALIAAMLTETNKAITALIGTEFYRDGLSPALESARHQTQYLVSQLTRNTDAGVPPAPNNQPPP